MKENLQAKLTKSLWSVLCRFRCSQGSGWKPSIAIIPRFSECLSSASMTFMCLECVESSPKSCVADISNATLLLRNERHREVEKLAKVTVSNWQNLNSKSARIFPNLSTPKDPLYCVCTL